MIEAEKTGVYLPHAVDTGIFRKHSKQEVMNFKMQSYPDDRNLDKFTFFWEGKYGTDMNSRDTLTTELNVLAEFEPVVPDNFQNCEFLMLGNLEPNIQRKVLKTIL